jgi:hypothetical protein
VVVSPCKLALPWWVACKGGEEGFVPGTYRETKENITGGIQRDTWKENDKEETQLDTRRENNIGGTQLDTWRENNTGGIQLDTWKEK